MLTVATEATIERVDRPARAMVPLAAAERSAFACFNTPPGGAWLNVAKSVQCILVCRVLTGRDLQPAHAVTGWLAAERRRNIDPMSFAWGGKREVRGQQARERERRQWLSNTGRSNRRPISIGSAHDSWPTSSPSRNEFRGVRPRGRGTFPDSGSENEPRPGKSRGAASWSCLLGTRAARRPSPRTGGRRSGAGGARRQPRSAGRARA